MFLLGSAFKKDIDDALMIFLIHHPDDEKRMGDLLVEHLSCGKWKIFRAAIAFVKSSGVKHIRNVLSEFSAKGSVTISVGIDHAGTSREGLAYLLEALGNRGICWVFQNSGARSTFHPKVYFFENEADAECFIGSGNLTEGGLYTNYEAFVHLKLSKSKAEDREVLAKLESILNSWTPPGEMAIRLTPTLIDDLSGLGLLPTELQIAEATTEIASKMRSITKGSQLKSPFGSKTVRPAPKVAGIRNSTSGGKPKEGIVKRESGSRSLTGFFMTLQQTDVGAGQKTTGTSRRSPEIFIPLAARDANPNFWGWSGLFQPDPSKSGKYDRQNVPMLLNEHMIRVNMMTWPDKSDFRLRNSELRSSGKVGDILRLATANANSGYNYVIEIIRPNDPAYAQYLALCTNSVRNSKKKWGYH